MDNRPTLFGRPVNEDANGDLWVKIDDTKYSVSENYVTPMFTVRSKTRVQMPDGKMKDMQLERQFDPQREGYLSAYAPLRALQEGILYLQPQIAAKQRELLGEDWFARNEAIDKAILEDALNSKRLEEAREQERIRAEDERKARELEHLETIPGWGSF